jgi:hypothetical protein
MRNKNDAGAVTTRTPAPKQASKKDTVTTRTPTPTQAAKKDTVTTRKPTPAQAAKKDVVAPRAQTPEQVFKALVQRCIESYALFGEDSLSLDYNRVTDTKLRSMIMQDYTYRQETKFIRAKKIMDDIKEIDELSRLAAGMSEPEADAEEDAEEEPYDVRGTSKPKKQKPKQKKSVTADKDMLNMRFKAAQERRALLSDINKIDGDEMDAVNFFFVPISRDEFERLETTEIFEERAVDETEAMSALAGTLKEKLPESENVTKNQLRPENSPGAPAIDFDEEGNVFLC